MRKPTNELLKKIAMYKKNRLDISELIKGIDIRGLDLSRAIIKNFEGRIGDNFSNTNFAYAQIGQEGIATNISNAIARHCSFKSTVFLGRIICHNTDFRNGNFYLAQLSGFDYQNADFRGCNFCRAIVRIGGIDGKGAKFDRKVIDELLKGWDVK